MAQQQNQTNTHITSEKVQQSNIYRKFFTFPICSVVHENSLQIISKKTKAGELQIISYFPVISNGKVVKMTEVHFGEKVVRIIDSFDYDLLAPPLQGSDEMLEEKEEESISVNSRRKKKGGFEVEPSRERNGKNVVKNIVKIFQKWIYQQTEPEQRLDQLLSDVMRENGQKFNSRLIQKIANNRDLSKAFLVFNQTSASEMVKASRISDKRTHYTFLKKCSRTMCQLGREEKVRVLSEKLEREKGMQTP